MDRIHVELLIFQLDLILMLSHLFSVDVWGTNIQFCIMLEFGDCYEDKIGVLLYTGIISVDWYSHFL